MLAEEVNWTQNINWEIQRCAHLPGYCSVRKSHHDCRHHHHNGHHVELKGFLSFQDKKLQWKYLKNLKYFPRSPLLPIWNAPEVKTILLVSNLVMHLNMVHILLLGCMYFHKCSRHRCGTDKGQIREDGNALGKKYGNMRRFGKIPNQSTPF